MPTINLQVGASTDDANGHSSTQSPVVGNIAAGDLTSTLLSPGFHGTGDYYSAGCRFTSVTIPQGATISVATLSLFADAYSSPGTIKYIVSCQAADNPATFNTSTGSLSPGNRPRTTATITWDQKTTTSAYQSVTITTAVQEVINRAGWASGNAIVVMLDPEATTTSGEWQDYHSWDNADTNNPKLDIIYSTGATAPFPPWNQQRAQSPLIRM